MTMEYIIKPKDLVEFATAILEKVEEHYREKLEISLALREDKVLGCAIGEYIEDFLNEFDDWEGTNDTSN